MNDSPKLPPGYYVTSIFRGNTRTYMVVRDSDNNYIVTGQDSEAIAIRRAVALIEGKPIDTYLKK